MRRVFPLLVLLLTACGLAENEQDEKNKLEYITLSDPAFARYCLSELDLNGDGRLSRYEALRIRSIDCSDWGIASMYEISEFTNLETLDCSSNSLAALDLSGCRYLSRVNCSANALTSLDLDGLRGLTELDCSHNRLATLDLRSNASLRVLYCTSNELSSLDITPCSGVMERVDCRANPALTRLYMTASQSVRTLQTDSQTVVERR